MSPRTAFIILFTVVFNVGIETTHAAPNAATREPTSRSGTLILEMPALELVSPTRLRHQTARLLATGSSVPEYHCAVSQHFINAMIPAKLEFEAGFRDVVTEIPVHGQSHARAALTVNFVPNRQQASLDLRLTGTIRMAAIGHTRGLRIDSDTTTTFSAVKRLVINNAEVRSSPTGCEARSRVLIGNITSPRPRAIGRFVERIARRRATSSLPQAEQESADHVEQAVCKYVDQYVQDVLQVVNETFRAHVHSLAVQDQVKWSTIGFSTDAESLFVKRGNVVPLAWANDDRPLEKQSLLLTMPRTRIGQNAGIGLLLLGELDEATDGQLRPKDFDAWPSIVFRPTARIESEKLFLALEIERDAPPVREESLTKVP